MWTMCCRLCMSNLHDTTYPLWNWYTPLLVESESRDLGDTKITKRTSARCTLKLGYIKMWFWDWIIMVWVFFISIVHYYDRETESLAWRNVKRLDWKQKWKRKYENGKERYRKKMDKWFRYDSKIGGRERGRVEYYVMLCFHNWVIDGTPARLVTFISILSGTMY